MFHCYRRFPVHCFNVALLILSLFALPASAQESRTSGFETRTFAITEAHVITQPGKEIHPGTVIIRNGSIAAAGPSDQLTPPPDCQSHLGQRTVRVCRVH